ncbi:DNA-directed RNA polymerase, partial [Cryomyces antarcticus]
NFQLEVARAYLNEDMYFPHNLDFRGRAYPIPPYLNHMGADNCRGLLRFSKGKELGTAGLFWLKVHLANVYGYDKASLQEREAFAMEHLADVYDSATNPLNGKRWWLGAEDEWQCLAACFELKHALDSPDPTRYVSHLPIHQDGTCNGLQHYAALGGDKAGAQQVNLEPRDRPSDIYSAVASLVEAEVDTEAAEGNMKAVTLKGKITRKVVKQTVMTNVYGVTFIGARAQVQKQLEILLPDLPRDKPDLTHNALAGYIAAKIFKSLGALFTGARAIQKWFGECANRIATTITSEQIEQLGRESRGEVIYLAPKLKDKALQKGKKRIQPTLMFRSSIIWTTPLKMPVVQPYRSVKSREIATNIQNISFVDPHATDPISRRKQLQGFPPNFIHSLDATHMLLSALKCDEEGLSFASVHDSFWTHAADIPKMNLVLRDAFVAMHGEDIIGRLASEFAARYKGSIYLASVYKRSKVGEQIHAWRSVKYASKRHANSAKHQIPELFEEAERQRLLSSEDPELRKQGEEMVTPASIFLAANDPSAFAVPSEIAMSELGRIDESASPEEAREDADLFASAFSDPSSAALAEAAEHNTVVDVEGEQYETSSDSDEAMDSVGAVTSGERDTSDKEKAMLDRVTEVTRELRADGAYVVPPRKRRPQHYKLSLWLPLTFPPVPEKGDFDVTRLKESQYFFS